MDLNEWAARRDALIARRVALESGLSRGQVERRLRSKRYGRIRRGVYAVNGAPPSWRQAVRAVLLAHEGRVVASHGTALRLLGVALPVVADGIHVSGDLNTKVRLDGVVGHRTGTLERHDVTQRDGMPCTSPLRTVIDMSGPLTVAQLGDVVDDFLRRRQLRLEHLRSRVERTLPAPGRSLVKLRAVLAARIPGYDPGESALEAKIMRILSQNRIPLPTQQHRVSLGGARYRLDFAWPEHRVYLEGNGFGWHQLSSDLDSDARRQNRLVIDGWKPIEITWRMSDGEIATTVAALVCS